MDAFGLETLLIETVGVGQAEYDVMDAADTVLVVLHPGSGDGIQAMKAGLLEVADVLVVNKADQPGADRLQTDLEEAVHVRFLSGRTWSTPVVACSAARGEFVERVVEAIAGHRAWLEVQGLERLRRAKRVAQVRHALGEGLMEAAWEAGGWRERAEAGLELGQAPCQVAAELLSDILGRLPPSPGESEARA
jgi:LAO/AO transport system kinase